MQYHTASVCIPAAYVRQAKAYVGERLPICTVIGFPNGYDTTAAKCFMATDAVEGGADEVDMVIHLGWVKDRRYDLVEQEIRQIKAACRGRLLKVIVETCLLTDEEKIAMCKVVTDTGADFIKTSTGFIAPDNIYSKVNDINIIQKYAPQLKIEIYGGVDTYKLANQLLTGGADLIGSDNGYEIVEKYRTLRENTQVTPKPIRFD